MRSPFRHLGGIATRALLAIAIAAASSACGIFSDSEPEPPPEPEILLPELTTENLFTVVNGSELIVEAEVAEVGPPPGRSEGHGAVQRIVYRVVDVLAGKEQAQVIAVTHPVHRARPFVNAEAGELSRAHVAPGRRFVLFLVRDADDQAADHPAYRVWSDRFGTLEATAAAIADVRKAIAADRRFGGGVSGDPFHRRR